MIYQYQGFLTNQPMSKHAPTSGEIFPSRSHFTHLPQHRSYIRHPSIAGRSLFTKILVVQHIPQLLVVDHLPRVLVLSDALAPGKAGVYTAAGVF